METLKTSEEVAAFYKVSTQTVRRWAAKGAPALRLPGQILRFNLEELRKWLEARGFSEDSPEPIPMVLHCPKCGAQHVDKSEPEKGWTNPPHKSHLCHQCGTIWRPADVPTTGVSNILTRGEKDTWPISS